MPPSPLDAPFVTSDVFVAGTLGVHTFAIPSLIVAPGGTLLAFCEARKTSRADASPTDMVLRRSTDGGRSWGPLQSVLAGAGAEAIMNSCPAIDRGSVLLLCINAHKTQHGRHRHILLRSDDDGASWSAPRDLTESVGDDTFIPGPGVGLRTRAGRLVVPGYFADYAPDRTRIASYSGVVFSDDAGLSWRAGRRVDYPMSNESQAVELADGSLLLNYRIQKDLDHPGCRGLSLSHDGGETWQPPTLAPALNEARCQAGLIRWAPPDGGPARLLFSNPNAHPGPHGHARTRMTLRLSLDEGRSWPIARLIHPGPTAYSVPAVLPDHHVALIYECGESHSRDRIRVARLSWNWLETGADAPPA